MRAPVLGSFVLVTIVAACRGSSDGDPIPRTLPGVYEYEAAGRALGHPWSFNMALELRRDGTYEMLTKSDIDGDRDTNTHRGRYIVRDNVVLLAHDEADPVDESETHRLDIRGDSLRADMPWVANAALRVVGAPKPILVRRNPARD
jgi:hypothetical protein